MAAIRRYFQVGMNKKDTESHWAEHNVGEKEIMLTIVSLSKDVTVQLHELNDDRTPYIGFFV